MVRPRPRGCERESGRDCSRVDYSSLYLPPLFPLPSLFIRADRPSSVPDHFDDNSADHSFIQLVHTILLPNWRLENEQCRETCKYANRSNTLGHWHTLCSVGTSFDIVHNRAQPCRRRCAERVAIVQLPHLARCKKVPGLFQTTREQKLIPY